MSRPVRIAAVIPTSDRAALVERAVESVLSQTRAPDEVLVVDDGSTDETAARLRRFGDRITVAVCGRVLGAAGARNLGAARVASPWVAFLDSDDLWRPQHLERLAEAVEATNGAAALYFGDTEMPGNQPAFWEQSGLTVTGPHRVAPDALDWALMPAQPMTVPASLFHRGRMLEAGGFGPLPTREDTYLYFLLAFREPFCAVRGAGARVTDDAGNSRLSRLYGPETLVYRQCSVRMYSDLWPMARRRGGRCATVLRERLVASQWSLAEAQWRAGRALPAAQAAASGLVRAPLATATRAVRRLAAPT